MLKRLRPRSAYDVMAMLALFVAVGTGSAYAANTIGSSDIIDESILSQDIKNGEVKYSDIGVGQVTGSRVTDESLQTFDVLNNTLTGADINESSLAQVPDAAQADKAPVEGYQEVVSDTFANPAGVQSVGSVDCPAGKKVVGGGVYGFSFATTQSVNSSYPTYPSRGWSVVVNNTGTSSTSSQVYAICAAVNESAAAAASAREAAPSKNK